MSEQEEFQPNYHIIKREKPNLTIDIPMSPSKTNNSDNAARVEGGQPLICTCCSGSLQSISPEILVEFVKNSKFIDCIKNIESITNKQSKRIDRLEIELYECRQALTDALYQNNNR